MTPKLLLISIKQMSTVVTKLMWEIITMAVAQSEGEGNGKRMFVFGGRMGLKLFDLVQATPKYIKECDPECILSFLSYSAMLLHH